MWPLPVHEEAWGKIEFDFCGIREDMDALVSGIIEQLCRQEATKLAAMPNTAWGKVGEIYETVQADGHVREFFFTHVSCQTIKVKTLGIWPWKRHWTCVGCIEYAGVRVEHPVNRWDDTGLKNVTREKIHTMLYKEIEARTGIWNMFKPSYTPIAATSSTFSTDQTAI